MSGHAQPLAFSDRLVLATKQFAATVSQQHQPPALASSTGLVGGAPNVVGSSTGSRPQAVPSPCQLATTFTRLDEGKHDAWGGRRLYALSLAPLAPSAPMHLRNRVVYEYKPDTSKSSSSGSHRARLCALGLDIFDVHVSGYYSDSGSFKGQIVGVQGGPHWGFEEKSKYKPFKKAEIDQYNPLCVVQAGSNADIEAARYCARVLASLLNPDSTTGAAKLKMATMTPEQRRKFEKRKKEEGELEEFALEQLVEAILGG